MRGLPEYHALATAIFRQALADLSHPRHAYDARRFLDKENEGFRHWCAVLGVDPEVMDGWCRLQDSPISVKGHGFQGGGGRQSARSQDGCRMAKGAEGEAWEE